MFTAGSIDETLRMPPENAVGRVEDLHVLGSAADCVVLGPPTPTRAPEAETSYVTVPPSLRAQALGGAAITPSLLEDDLEPSRHSEVPEVIGSTPRAVADEQPVAQEPKAAAGGGGNKPPDLPSIRGELLGPDPDEPQDIPLGDNSIDNPVPTRAKDEPQLADINPESGIQMSDAPKAGSPEGQNVLRESPMTHRQKLAEVVATLRARGIEPEGLLDNLNQRGWLPVLTDSSKSYKLIAEQERVDTSHVSNEASRILRTLYKSEHGHLLPLEFNPANRPERPEGHQPPTSVGAYLNDIRRTTGITYVELQEILGVSESALSRFFAGTTHPSTIGRFTETLRVLGVEGEEAEQLIRLYNQERIRAREGGHPSNLSDDELATLRSLHAERLQAQQVRDAASEAQARASYHRVENGPDTVNWYTVSSTGKRKELEAAQAGASDAATTEPHAVLTAVVRPAPMYVYGIPYPRDIVLCKVGQGAPVLVAEAVRHESQRPRPTGVISPQGVPERVASAIRDPGDRMYYQPPDTLVFSVLPAVGVNNKAAADAIEVAMSTYAMDAALRLAPNPESQERLRRSLIGSPSRGINRIVLNDYTSAIEAEHDSDEHSATVGAVRAALHGLGCEIIGINSILYEGDSGYAWEIQFKQRDNTEIDRDVA